MYRSERWVWVRVYHIKLEAASVMWLNVIEIPQAAQCALCVLENGTLPESQTPWNDIQNKGASDPIDPQRLLFVCRAHHTHTAVRANKKQEYCVSHEFLSRANTLHFCAQQTISHHLQKARAQQKHNTKQSFFLPEELFVYFSIIIFVRRILLSQPLKVARSFSPLASATIIKIPVHTQQLHIQKIYAYNNKITNLSPPCAYPRRLGFLSFLLFLQKFSLLRFQHFSVSLGQY